MRFQINEILQVLFFSTSLGDSNNNNNITRDSSMEIKMYAFIDNASRISRK